MSYGTKILELLRKQPDMTMFLECERYVIDFDDDLRADQWMQYDTDQDAAYFGVWVNPNQREVLTYAEGDWSLQSFATREDLIAQLEDMARFYGSPPPAFVAIDASGKTVRFFDDRPTADGQGEEK